MPNLPSLIVFIYGFFHSAIFLTFNRIDSCGDIYLVFPSDIFVTCSVSDMQFSATLWTSFSVAALIATIIFSPFEKNTNANFCQDKFVKLGYLPFLIFGFVAALGHIEDFGVPKFSSAANVITHILLPILIVIIPVRTTKEAIVNLSALLLLALLTASKQPLLLFGLKFLVWQFSLDQRSKLKTYVIFVFFFLLVMHAIVEFRSYKKGEPQHGEQNPVVTIFTRSVQRFLLFEPTIVNKRGIDYEKKITGDNVSSVQNVISGLLINKGYALGLPNNLALKYGPILGGALGGGTSTAAFIMINKILGLFFLPQARIPLAILSLALLMLDFGKTAIFYHASLLGVVCSIWVCNRFSVPLMKRFLPAPRRSQERLRVYKKF